LHGNIQLNRSKEEGNKKFYDNIVLSQLKKIAAKYNVEVETINIEPDKYLKLQENLKKLKEKGFEEVTIGINELRDYIEWRATSTEQLPDFREIIMNTTTQFRGEDFDSLIKNKIYDKDSFAVFKNKETGEINFEYPVVNTKFSKNFTLKQFFEQYQQWSESRGESLIKMKLPKKLQNDILKEPIKISKIDEQTQRLVA
jgi:hypothetical protein